MELEALLTALSTTAFPVGFCGVMFWYMNKERESHAQEVKEMTAVISKNTEALLSLKQMIEDKL